MLSDRGITKKTSFRTTGRYCLFNYCVSSFILKLKIGYLFKNYLPGTFQETTRNLPGTFSKIPDFPSLGIGHFDGVGKENGNTSPRVKKSITVLFLSS